MSAAVLPTRLCVWPAWLLCTSEAGEPRSPCHPCHGQLCCSASLVPACGREALRSERAGDLPPHPVLRTLALGCTLSWPVLEHGFLVGCVRTVGVTVLCLRVCKALPDIASLKSMRTTRHSHSKQAAPSPGPSHFPPPSSEVKKHEVQLWAW